MLVLEANPTGAVKILNVSNCAFIKQKYIASGTITSNFLDSSKRVILFTFNVGSDGAYDYQTELYGGVSGNLPSL